ncbi:phage tail protein [Lelliottia aquatilis]|uniref:phage tail-collar fiber domain-containing protein n=1 Tax=Lelliottia aquatilis TaxID=2080838 RepID=UPI001577200B|nr:phage tail protein [Lelliottia aquatilis]NTZ45230.1 phage tail protein [Lelliottia aquatilis]
MTVKYKTVITKAGTEKLAAATLPNGKKVNFAAMAVGDGGGKLPEPNASQTKLVNEVWRHALNKISQDKKHKNYVVAELVIPPETGGFWLREMGLYDDTGSLIAVGNMAESYKPELAEGSGRAQTLRMVIMVSDIDTVELSIDTTLVMATQDYVDDQIAEHEQSRRHPDATLKEKGFTQLSSATDSASEALAATPKAVKAVYDFASAKYTAQDATTAQKGIVQLSSATDSTSEALAATPKAVSAAVKALKDTLGTAAKADVVTSMSDTTAGRVPVTGWMGLGGSPRNTTLENEAFASFWRDTVQAKSGITLPYDGSPTLNYFAIDGANHTAYIGRKVGAGAISWVKLYSEYNKPTAADVGALKLQLTNLNVDLNTLGTQAQAGMYQQQASASATATNHYPVSEAGSLLVSPSAYGCQQEYTTYASRRKFIRGLTSSFSGNGPWTEWNEIYSEAYPGEISGKSVNNFRIAYGDYGTFWRNDGANLYLMLTNKGDKFGNYNALRPFRVSLETGAVALGTVNLDKPSINDWTNIDARYYTKAQSDAGYMAKTGAYTKAESDGRYPLKTATVIDVRQGSAGTIILTRNGWNYVPAGCAFTGWYVEGDAPVGDTIQYKPMQININGAWRTISG